MHGNYIFDSTLTVCFRTIFGQKAPDINYFRSGESRMRGRQTATDRRDERGSLVQYIYGQFIRAVTFGQFRRVLAFGQSRHVVTYVMCVESHLLRTKID